jgi:hypothetical protein
MADRSAHSEFHAFGINAKRASYELIVKSHFRLFDGEFVIRPATSDFFAKLGWRNAGFILLLQAKLLLLPV